MAFLLLLAGCAAPRSPAPALTVEPPPEVAVAAPAAGPAAEPEASFAIRGDGPPPLDAARALDRIAIGGGIEETRPIPALGAVATLRPDLFLAIGDNVTAESSGDARLPALRQAYADLSMNAHFSAFNMATPMLAVWSASDASREVGGVATEALAERAFETFWRDAAVGRDHAGVHGARLYGPPGRQVRIVLLDIDPTDPGGLGEAQWTWLEAELRKPSEIRLLVAPRVHPRQRERLHRLLRESGAGGVVLVSLGAAGGVGLRPASDGVRSAELVVASMNRSGDPRATGFGLVEIDWPRRRLTVSARDGAGLVRSQRAFTFADLGLAR